MRQSGGGILPPGMPSSSGALIPYTDRSFQALATHASVALVKKLIGLLNIRESLLAIASDIQVCGMVCRAISSSAPRRR